MGAAVARPHLGIILSFMSGFSNLSLCSEVKSTATLGLHLQISDPQPLWEMQVPAGHRVQMWHVRVQTGVWFGFPILCLFIPLKHLVP